jgi:hypothetical protein
MECRKKGRRGEIKGLRGKSECIRGVGNIGGLKWARELERSNICDMFVFFYGFMVVSRIFRV